LIGRERVKKKTRENREICFSFWSLSFTIGYIVLKSEGKRKGEEEEKIL
jgi:hypothetical protein